MMWLTRLLKGREEKVISIVEQIAGEKFTRRPQLLPVANQTQINHLLSTYGILPYPYQIGMEEVYIPAEHLVIYTMGKMYPDNLAHVLSHSLSHQVRDDISGKKTKENILNEIFAHVMTYKFQRHQGVDDRVHQPRLDATKEELVFVYEHQDQAQGVDLYLNLCGRGGLSDYICRLSPNYMCRLREGNRRLPRDVDEYLQEVVDKLSQEWSREFPNKTSDDFRSHGEPTRNAAIKRELYSKGILPSLSEESGHIGGRYLVPQFVSHKGQLHLVGCNESSSPNDCIVDSTSFIRRDFGYFVLTPNDYLHLKEPFLSLLVDDITNAVGSKIIRANFEAMLESALKSAEEKTKVGN